MKRIEILLNPESPIHDELEAGLRANLDALDSVTYTVKRQPVKPGTLFPGLDQAVAFLVEHPEKTADVVVAIISAATMLIDWAKGKSAERKEKPIIIVVDNEKLPLPASEQARRKFLRRIGGQSDQPTPTDEPSRGHKKSRPKGGRKGPRNR